MTIFAAVIAGAAVCLFAASLALQRWATKRAEGKDTWKKHN